ncbi:hypothetical protein AQUCO_00900532v1 [Aquilegia coerulea]|uniref:Subtilisin-like protease fibronectin type-III domain-containing protein n=1 Tax=Aquilegia coerulea TaxID=218851 RepID=A0A2G5EE35_AQUCA|nr:hypothetical protein AQUCO_00900532v1 [Aquilegia coerulea]
MENMSDIFAALRAFKCKDNDPALTTQSHFQLLSKIFSSEEEIMEALLYSYKHSFSGFSAMLNSTQADTLTNMEGVISVFRSNVLQLHTTRSWEFLGLSLEHNNHQVTPMQLVYGGDIVVGIFDTASSFQESPDIGPIPSSWKGTCVKGEKFDPTIACNRKLIGARYYLKGLEQMFGPLNSSSGNDEYRSSRDFLGHGTHTASTAVGSIVTNASFSRLAMGIARGGAPRSRLAVYKVCWSIQLDGRCTEADILAGFDDALHDGVDVISASFGGSAPLLPFFVSSSDIGSFHATQLGINVVFSGGNDGVEPGLVANVAPWSICVAASSIDRKFSTQLIINNNFTIMGESFNLIKMKASLVYGSRYFNGGSCNIDNWNKKSATGKIILCFSTVGSVLASEASIAAFAANASALIFVEPMTKQFSEVDIIPIIRIPIDQGTRILHYIAQSPKDPKVLVQPSKTTIAQSPAPAVAYFSSRGPSSLAPDILKPDITAPGINILAAWPPKSPPTLLPIDHRSVNWNIQSGTSMSCPHVSGVVALLKSAHPDWSPAAIKSALMTTAETRDISGDHILAGGSMKLTDPFDIGAGHINPVKALDPGLVYDMSTQDYVVFLCNIGYNEKQIKNIVGQSSCIDTSCPKTKSSNAELNFPSITISNLQHSMTIKRTVRNVGHSNAIYFVKIVNPHGVHVEIWPKMLIFSSHCREKSYYVTITPEKHSQGRFDFGEIVWSDGHHYVRIPFVVCVNTTVSVSDSSAHVSI